MSPRRDWPRIIVHADMDAFYAAVEQRDNPELRGKPIVIGSRSPRSVVSTASYEARPFGLRSAMPMATALRLCPQVIVVPPRMARYKEVSDRIMAVFETYSPLVEPLSLDEAFVDMTGAEALFGTPAEMGVAIKRDVFAATDGLTVSVGVAANKFVAKVASDFRKPDGLTLVPPGHEQAFLWPMPVSRLWGVGPVAEKALLEMGLKTIKDVAACSVPRLRERFGDFADHLRNLALGVDAREVSPREASRSVGREYTLDRDVRGFDQIWIHLRHAADSVGQALRKDEIVASGVRVKLKTSGFRLITRQGALSPPSDSPARILEVARELLGKFDLNESYRLVGLSAFQLAKAPSQQELFENSLHRKDRRLNETLDRVSKKFGRGALQRAEDLEDDDSE